LRATSSILILGAVVTACLVATSTPAAQAPGSARAVLDVPDEAFEVASVKPNRSGREQWDFDAPPGRVIGTNVALRDLIRFAYYVYGGDFDLRIDAPGWIKTARFDVEGTTKGVVTQARAMAMLRQLLVERFALKVHYEAREQPAYALMLARGDGRLGPSLKPNPTDCAALSAANEAARAAGAPPVIALDPDKRPICGTRGAPGTHISGALTMEQLALQLARNVGRPVVNRTGLKGTFDWDLRWAPDDTLDRDPAGTFGPSIFTALQEQLGLKLDATTAPIEVLVVDRVEQPTEN
jgi:uncharacterized protein (TIGR03435 family)